MTDLVPTDGWHSHTDEQRKAWLRAMAVRLRGARRYQRHGTTMVTIVMPASAADVTAHYIEEAASPFRKLERFEGGEAS